MNSDKLSLLIYTNETFLPIAELSTFEYDKYFSDIDIKKYLVSNNFPENDLLNYNNFIKINSEIPLENEGRHFAKVLIKALKKIDTEFVLFTLDDLFIINYIKKNNLQLLINFMVNENVDHLSLMSYGHNWDVMNINYKEYGIPDNYFLNFNTSYCHMITLQPMIWKTSSFIELLNYNLNISLKEFDTSNFKNKKGENRSGFSSYGYYEIDNNFWDFGFKHCCFNRFYENTPYSFDDRPLDGDYFLFLWTEVIAGGKFNFNRGHNCKIYLEKYLQEKNINRNNKLYQNFF